MAERTPEPTRQQHLKMVREAWDLYHPDYMQFNLKARPDFHAFFRDGGVDLDHLTIELVGNVEGLRLLDVCCAGDAMQAFSWENLGASVVACDLSPKAIEISRDNARVIGSSVEFIVADAQQLAPIPDEQFDVVFATYIRWFEDIFKACETWHRVLKPGGRLYLNQAHPVTQCLEEQDGKLVVRRVYSDTSPQYGRFYGTGLADRYGGWSVGPQCVLFFHRLADVVNAIAEAGFLIKKMVERVCWEEGEGPLGKLPVEFDLIAKKGLQ